MEGSTFKECKTKLIKENNPALTANNKAGYCPNCTLYITDSLNDGDKFYVCGKITGHNVYNTDAKRPQLRKRR